MVDFISSRLWWLLYKPMIVSNEIILSKEWTLWYRAFQLKNKCDNVHIAYGYFLLLMIVVVDTTWKRYVLGGRVKVEHFTFCRCQRDNIVQCTHIHKHIKHNYLSIKLMIQRPLHSLLTLCYLRYSWLFQKIMKHLELTYGVCWFF